MQREYPSSPVLAIGAVIVDADRVLLVRRSREPLRGQWSLPGGALELGESLADGVKREVREETGLEVEPVELIELIDRIHRQNTRQDTSKNAPIRFHYVIADYLCRVVGGHLCAASDATEARWVERPEWNSHSALKLDPVTVRIIELGWKRAQLRRAAKETK
ncbi:MAG TPA: NUDIX hydrolase [Terracidiphilus sp.]|nr:NUDIX hydrolase [Terracidiphilus sp.]